MQAANSCRWKHASDASAIDKGARIDMMDELLVYCRRRQLDLTFWYLQEEDVSNELLKARGTALAVDHLLAMASRVIPSTAYHRGPCPMVCPRWHACTDGSYKTTQFAFHDISIESMRLPQERLHPS